MRYVGIAFLVALLIDLVGYGWIQRARRLTPLAAANRVTSSGLPSPGTDAATPQTGRRQELTMALAAVGRAWNQKNQPGEGQPGAVPTIPTLDPVPPLQQAMLESNSRPVQGAIRELRSWLKITAGNALVSCWRQTPDPPVWLELAADLSRQGPQVLGVSDVRLMRLRGTYALTADEERCFTENLAAIGSRSVSQEEMAILELHLPASESFLLQWPCGACMVR